MTDPLVVVVSHGTAHVFKDQGRGRVRQFARVDDLAPDAEPAQHAALALGLAYLLSGNAKVEVQQHANGNGNGRIAAEAMQRALVPAKPPSPKRAARPMIASESQVLQSIAEHFPRGEFSVNDVNDIFATMTHAEVSKRIMRLVQKGHLRRVEKGTYVYVPGAIDSVRIRPPFKSSHAVGANGRRNIRPGGISSADILHWLISARPPLVTAAVLTDHFAALTGVEANNRILYLKQSGAILPTDTKAQFVCAPDIDRLLHIKHEQIVQDREPPPSRGPLRPGSVGTAPVLAWVMQKYETGATFVTHDVLMAFPMLSRIEAMNRITAMVTTGAVQRLGDGQYRYVGPPTKSISAG